MFARARAFVRSQPWLLAALKRAVDVFFFFLDIPRRARLRLSSLVSYVCDRAGFIAVEKVAVPVGRRLSARRIRKGKPRTFWGVTPILTLPVKARCDRLLGFESESVVFTTYTITRNFDVNLEKLIATTLRWAPRLYLVVHRFVLAWALLRYDIFHTFADRAVMPSPNRIGIDPWEMDQLQRASKRLYVYCYGADVRTRKKTLSLGRWNFCVECPKPTELCICDDDAGAKNMKEIEKRATAIVSLGDMLEYVPHPVHLDYWPIDTDALEYIGTRQCDGPLKIAHAPNHPYFKGSKYLQATVEELRAEGHQIELILISGVSNSRVLEIFAECDVVADQLIGGAYGYTALEGMARGKPVITYVRSPDLAEASQECPLVIATPDTLKDVLVWALKNRRKLSAVGAQGRIYVERWHSLNAVAERLGQLYERTANLPEASLTGIRIHREGWIKARGRILETSDWRHPWQVTGGAHP